MTKKTASDLSWRELFGLPPVLLGEDAAAEEEISRRVEAALAPVDIIGEISVANYVCDLRDGLRWRRFKSTVMQQAYLRTLKRFLLPHIEYSRYRAKFEEAITETLVGKGQTIEDAEKLARECARNSSEAVDAVNEVLHSLDLKMDEILDQSRDATAWNLARDYHRGIGSVVKWVDGLFAEEELKLQDLLIPEFVRKLDLVDRVDRLITISEARGNTTLREFDRRRETLGAALRRSVQEVEHDASQKLERKPILKRDAA